MPVLEQSPVVSSELAELRLGAPSRLELRFYPDGGLTRMVVTRQESPWRALRAFQNAQRQAMVHLHNVSGGILSGDALDLLIDAEERTSVQVTSVGATRIYRHRTGRCPARLTTSIRIGEGALLEYLPDAVIPFAGSNCSQATTVSLGPNAGFIGWEILAAGRIASGEEFEFDCFHSAYSIQADARPIALERYRLVPSVRDPRSIARWGRFRYTATMYICHTGVAAARWSELEHILNEMAFARTSDGERWGVSTIVASGLIVRVLALEAHQVTAGLHVLWNRAKQEIWGESAVPPRKIN